MKSKTEIALNLLQIIQDLELSPPEIQELTVVWITKYPESLASLETGLKKFLSTLHSSKETDALDKLLSRGTLRPLTDENDATEHASSQPEAEQGQAAQADDKKETQTPAPKVLVLPQKGYSKNGKKLGRPKKQKSEQSAVAPLKLPSPDKTPETAAISTEETPKVSPLMKTPVPDDHEIEALKFGKTYTLDALYELNNVFIRTHRLMNGTAHPIGVIVPYLEQDKEGEILVRFEDEHAKIPLKQAQQYAKHKLLPVYGRHWRLKEAADDMHIRSSGHFPELNTMLKKMGGDELKGNYFDGHRSYFADKFDHSCKIRYVCDIVLPTDDTDNI